MKAVTVGVGGGLSLDEVAVPEPGPGQVRVRIVYGGICGSDLHYAATGRNGVYTVEERLVLGHEVVGIVDRLGPAVGAGLTPGQHVAIHPARPTPPPGGVEGAGLRLAKGGSYLGSASTRPHTPGGFAEHLVVDAVQLRTLPPGLPLRRAALAEPLAVSVHGVRQATGAFEGRRVLVAGSGPIGALAIGALRAQGAGEIIASDVAARPLETAAAVGADRTILLGVDAEPEPESIDVVIESSGNPRSLSSALSWIERGGTIVQLGLLPPGTLDVALAPLVSKEVLLRGSQRFDVELDEAVRILDTEASLDIVVSHVFPMDEALEAFETAADPARSSKVLLQFGDDPTLD